MKYLFILLFCPLLSFAQQREAPLSANSYLLPGTALLKIANCFMGNAQYKLTTSDRNNYSFVDTAAKGISIVVSNEGAGGVSIYAYQWPGHFLEWQHPGDRWILARIKRTLQTIPDIKITYTTRR